MKIKVNKIKEAIEAVIKEQDLNKGYTVARNLIDKLRATTFKKFNDDELEEFRKTIANAFDMQLKEESLDERVVSDNESPSIKAKKYAEDFMYEYRKMFRIVDGNFGKEAAEEFKTIVKTKMSQLQEGLNEDEGTLNKIADILGDKFDDLRFDVNTAADRIDVRGSQQDLMNFGDKLHGEKIFDYEVFATDDDDRGEIVRIVKSDSISRGGVNEEMDPKEMKTGTYAGKKVVIHMHGPETEWKVEFIDTGKIVDYIDLMANLKFDDGTTYMDYLKEKKDKADRCLRIARRKNPQSSAYRSGLIVKCRKGMIWKDLK